MKSPKIGWFGAQLLGLLLIPVFIYVVWCQSILKSHLKTEVTNDPKSGLSLSLSRLRLALENQSQNLLFKANQMAQNERLKKALSPPPAKLSKFKSLGRDFTGTYQTPLFILTNKNGGVLFDTLDILSPTPSPSPNIDKKKNPSSSKKQGRPLLFQANNFPGLASALKGSSSTGIFIYEGRLFLAAAAPILLDRKTIGSLLIGVPWNGAFLEKIRNGDKNGLVFYSDGKIQWSSFPPLCQKELGVLASSGAGSCLLESQDYIWSSIPVADMNQNPAGTLAIFQPSKQSLTLEGHPQKTIWKLGLFLLAFLAAGGLWLCHNLLSPLGHMTEAVEKIRDGDRNPSLPVRRLDEWGGFARALAEMAEKLREKERVALILGKVPAPQAAQKILSQKDYFALKGERRECSILQVDLRGFNVLSENLKPAALVEALNQYFTLIQEIVFKHEGMMDKFIGETAIAVWGAPFSPEDKEQRAVQAALDIQEALKEFNISRIKKNFPSFTLGMGIHTGTVVTGNLGSEMQFDYGIIGEPLHLVARLCAMAAPGQVVASAETYEKVKTWVRSNPLKPIAVKGAAEALPTYEILPES